MATFITYAEFDFSDLSSVILKSNSPNSDNVFTVGYLNLNPDEVLKQLISRYYIDEYLGISIPCDSVTSRLRINVIHDGFGINGTIKMVYRDMRIQNARRDKFSEADRMELIEKLKKQITPIFPHTEPLYLDDREFYSHIFGALGHPIGPAEIYVMSKHPDYGKPLLLEDTISH
jgi:hypothetical protein